MDKVDVEVLNIDDKDYYVVAEIEHGPCSYLYLSAVDNDRDMRIWKTHEDDPNIIGPLDSREEFDLACLLFQQNQR